MVTETIPFKSKKGEIAEPTVNTVYVPGGVRLFNGQVTDIYEVTSDQLPHYKPQGLSVKDYLGIK